MAGILNTRFNTVNQSAQICYHEHDRDDVSNSHLHILLQKKILHNFKLSNSAAKVYSWACKFP